MKNILLICMMIFSLVLSWGAVIAEEGFYVIAVKKNNFASVPITGQTTSYATGDDGQLEKGVAWPNPRFTDNGDGTVTDNLTGLIWLKDTNCRGQRTWADALSDCNTLNSGECELTDGSSEGDWRLPNIKELQSLIDYGQATPALPSGYYDFFTPTIGIYWSNTTDADDTGNAWYVALSHGYVYYEGKTYDHYVWPVRGGQ